SQAPTTIIVPAGVYQLTVTGAGEDAAATGDLDIADDITIVGAGAGATIIDGLASDRVFDIHSGNVSMSGLTITDGCESSGGGIQDTGGSLSLNRCALVNNRAASVHGGAISDLGATLSLTGCAFDGNIAAQHGGAIDSPGVNLTVVGCTFTNNHATDGGALSIGDGTVMITGSSFIGNHADNVGGAINSNFNADFT